MENNILSRIVELIKRKKLSLAPFAIFFVLIGIGQIISPGFASIGHLRYVFMLTVPYGIMGIGETFVILSGKEDLDFSIGALGSLAVVLGAQLFEIYSFSVTMLIILSIGLAFGILNGVGVRIFGVPPLVMTFGTASVMLGTGIAYTQGNPGGTTGPLLRKMAIGEIGGFPIIIIIWIILSILAFFILHKTTYGRCLYASGSNPEASRVAGISTTKIGIIAYALSGLFAAFAGSLMLGRVESPAQFYLARELTLPVIAGVVLGGTNFFGGEGGYLGTIGGVLALVTLASFLPRLGVPSSGRIFMDGVILIIILLFYARRATLRK